MITNSQDSVTPVPASSLFHSLAALPNRIFDAIDLASLLLAMKSSLAIVLSIGIAFWLGNISAGIAATTALMIQMPFAGSTIQRGIMRFVGGITGWIAALVLLAFFSQDRVLFVGSMSMAVGVWGHSSTHRPHPTHPLGSITGMAGGISLIAFSAIGHTSWQYPQTLPR